MNPLIHSITIETGGVLLVVAVIIIGMIGVCVAIWPRKRRPDGKWDLQPSVSPTPERRYREAGE